MKKSLIALAVATAAASAAAQSSVTLFGLVDIGYGSHKTTGNGGRSISSQGVMDGGLAGQRIGFRGSENLGGGITADFWVEQGLSMTNGAMFGVRAGASGHQYDGFSAAGSGAALGGTAGAYTQATNRQTWAGLRGGFGNFRIGYQYTNLYEVTTLSGYVISSEGVQGGDKAHLISVPATHITRANGLTYISPKMSGFEVRLQYGAGTGRESFESSAANAASDLTRDNARRSSFMVKYDQGPLSGAVAYTKYDVQQSARVAEAAGGSNVYGALINLTAITNAAQRGGSIINLGASYDFKVAKFYLTHADGENGGTGTSTVNTKFKGTNVGVSVPFGKTAPFLSMGRASATNSQTGVKSEDYDLLQIGVRHSMSPRTTVYAIHGTTKNDAAAAIAEGYTKDTKTVVGISHSF